MITIIPIETLTAIEQRQIPHTVIRIAPACKLAEVKIDELTLSDKRSLGIVTPKKVA
ncbi:MAG: hypothetical protein V4615_05075 [Bacteroidota bacterium]